MTELERYATDVLDGRIVACRRIKQVYEKLLEDLYRTSGPWHFDEAEANRHIEFIETFCRQAQGRLGAPLALQPFQKAKFQAIFGFLDDNNLRRYNEALTIEGRKNGKTTEMAAVALDLLVNDGEGSPEIYFLATKHEQAYKGFSEAHKMVRQSPDLRRHIRKRQSDLYFPLNMGHIQALSSNTNGLDGLNAHAGIIDELAAIRNRDIYDLTKQSMSSRAQPLLFAITTNGFVRENIFDSQYDYACRVLDGLIDDERFIAFIYEMDGPEEWRDEKNWIKANPGLGTIKSWDFLRGSVNKALTDLSYRPTVMVKDFNYKQTGEASWLRWEELSNDETFDQASFRYCIGGFDAADSIDLNAAKAVMVRPGDPKIYVRSMYWLPEEQLKQTQHTGSRRERDNMPYQLWAEKGLLRIVPGNRVPRSVFLDWFRELREENRLYTLYIGYDPWHVEEDLLREFRLQFGPNCMIPVRQGPLTLSQPMKDLAAEFRAENIVYSGNPIDKMCLANTQTRADVNGNIQPVKGLDSRRRIDGTVALLCAYKVLCDKRQDLEALNNRRRD